MPASSVVVVANAGSRSGISGGDTSGLGSASSLADICALIPVTFREILKKYCVEFMDLVNKFATVDSTLEKLQRHSADGSFPASLQGMHKPVMQVTKRYEQGSEAATALLATFEKTWSDARGSLLAQMIAIKEAEKAYLKGALSISARTSEVEKSIKDTYLRAGGAFRVTDVIWQASQVTSSAPSQEAAADVGRLMDGVPEWLDKEYKAVKGVWQQYIQRAVVLETAKVNAGLDKKLAKLKLRDDADTVMADAVAGGPAMTKKTVEDIVKTVLASSAKKAKKGKGKAPQKPAKSQSRYPHACIDEDADEDRDQVRKRPREDGQEGQAPQERGEKRRRGQEAERQARTQEEVVSDPSWRYEHPLSYPDKMLTLSKTEATHQILARAPIAQTAWYMAAREKRCHLGPGIIVDADVSSCVGEICEGMKFLFFVHKNFDLPVSAFDSFANKLRWQEFWYNRGNDTPFDPKYKLAPKGTIAEKGSKVLELGLAAGRAELLEQIRRAKAEPSLVSSTVGQGTTYKKIKQVRQILSDKKILVKSADKNLGVVLVTFNWYHTEVMKHLDDLTTYRRLENSPFFNEEGMANGEIIGQMRLLEHLCLDLRQQGLMTIQEAKWVVEEMDDHVLPSFHVIPKIHKNPWKTRPIVPNWSMFSSRAAKWVAAKIHKYAVRHDSVCESTRQLVERMGKIKIKNHRKTYIVTGDVTSMYTNIPKAAGKTKVEELLHTWYRTEVRPSLSEQEQINMMLQPLNRLAELVNTDALFYYKEHTYQQIRGLPMGAPQSPDVANAYMAEHEEELKIPHVDRPRWMLFYQRYIDDIYSLVQADSEEEAVQLVTDYIKIPYLDITWQASKDHAVFLDLYTYLDPVYDTIQFRPYEKPGNLYHRVPWSSSHPLHVKKAVVLGEMTRLAVGSSHKRNYINALERYQVILLHRGYPEKVVQSWVRKNLNERWGRRLDEAGSFNSLADLPLAVIKSSYNPIWERLNVREIQTVMRMRWQDPSSNVPEVIKKARLLVSLRKGTSLGDVLNANNKEIIRGTQVDDSLGETASFYAPIFADEGEAASTGRAGPEVGGSSSMNTQDTYDDLMFDV